MGQKLHKDISENTSVDVLVLLHLPPRGSLDTHLQLHIHISPSNRSVIDIMHSDMMCHTHICLK